MRPLDKRRNVLLVAGPAMIPIWLSAGQIGAPDLLQGLIAGVGVGLSLLAVIHLQRCRT